MSSISVAQPSDLRHLSVLPIHPRNCCQLKEMQIPAVLSDLFVISLLLSPSPSRVLVTFSLPATLASRFSGQRVVANRQQVLLLLPLASPSQLRLLFHSLTRSPLLASRSSGEVID